MQPGLGGDGRMRPDGMTAGAEAPGLIALRDPDRLRSGTGDGPPDPGIRHLLEDAEESKGEIFKVGRSAPGPGEGRPRADEVIIFSAGLALGLKRQRWG